MTGGLSRRHRPQDVLNFGEQLFFVHWSFVTQDSASGEDKPVCTLPHILSQRAGLIRRPDPEVPVVRRAPPLDDRQDLDELVPTGDAARCLVALRRPSSGRAGVRLGISVRRSRCCKKRRTEKSSISGRPTVGARYSYGTGDVLMISS